MNIAWACGSAISHTTLHTFEINSFFTENTTLTNLPLHITWLSQMYAEAGTVGTFAIMCMQIKVVCPNLGNLTVCSVSQFLLPNTGY
jgi:hypothetical protein